MSTPAAAAPTCPQCGSVLVAVALDPTTAPWLCNVCRPRMGWWNAETTVQARSLYRGRGHDFGRGPAAEALRAAVEAELAAAVSAHLARRNG